jgi:ribosome modulation factor
MRRQKRDKMERAFQKGYQAGVEGKSKDQCPKTEGPEHQQWVNGWREGRSDHWDGYTGVSGIHRVNEVIIHH